MINSCKGFRQHLWLCHQQVPVTWAACMCSATWRFYFLEKTSEKNCSWASTEKTSSGTVNNCHSSTAPRYWSSDPWFPTQKICHFVLITGHPWHLGIWNFGFLGILHSLLASEGGQLLAKMTGPDEFSDSSPFFYSFTLPLNSPIVLVWCPLNTNGTSLISVPLFLPPSDSFCHWRKNKILLCVFLL